MFYLDGYVVPYFADLETNLLPRPNVHHYLQEMNQNVLKDYDVMIVGDMSGNLDFYEALKYVAKERKELSMVFHFAHMQIVRKTLRFIPITRLTLFRTKDRKVNGIFESTSLQNLKTKYICGSST
jgi:glycosidase